jgi:hypothetical protein
MCSKENEMPADVQVQHVSLITITPIRVCLANHPGAQRYVRTISIRAQDGTQCNLILTSDDATVLAIADIAADGLKEMQG